MTYKYMSAEASLAFPASSPLANTVYLNTDKTRFKLLRAPSIAELKAGVEEYATKRAAILWREMAQIEDDRCRLFAYVSNAFNNVNKATVTSLLGSTTAGQAVRQELRGGARSSTQLRSLSRRAGRKSKRSTGSSAAMSVQLGVTTCLALRKALPPRSTSSAS